MSGLLTKTEDNFNKNRVQDDVPSYNRLTLGFQAGLTQKSGNIFGDTFKAAGSSTHRAMLSGYHQNNTQFNGDESLSYKALMEMKGSKCTCLPQFNYQAAISSQKKS